MKIVWKIILGVWFMAWTILGIKIYLATPRQITKDEQFKTDRIDPVVQATKDFVTSNKRLPTDKEFKEFKLEGELILNYSDLPDELNDEIKISDWDNGTYAIAVWRGEWNEGYISKGDKYILNNYSKSDGVIGLLVTIGVALFPALLTLWASKKKQNKSGSAQQSL
jgi:hypothetical protein